MRLQWDTLTISQIVVFFFFLWNCCFFSPFFIPFPCHYIYTWQNIGRRRLISGWFSDFYHSLGYVFFLIHKLLVKILSYRTSFDIHEDDRFMFVGGKMLLCHWTHYEVYHGWLIFVQFQICAAGSYWIPQIFLSNLPLDYNSENIICLKVWNLKVINSIGKLPDTMK